MKHDGPGSKPTHNLCVQRKPSELGERHPIVQVGVAWLNSNGSITIKLDDCTVLDWRTMETHGIWLYENKPHPKVA